MTPHHDAPDSHVLGFPVFLRQASNTFKKIATVLYNPLYKSSLILFHY